MEEFFIKYPVFTISDLKDYRLSKSLSLERTIETLLAYYVERGRLIRIKRGLYAVVPKGSNPDTFSPDPFLLASKMSDDAVLINHTALEFFGYAYSIYHRFTYQTVHSNNQVQFRGNVFFPVSIPGELMRKKKEEVGVITKERQGQNIRVSSIERTLVDCLDKPKVTGSWEEIWRSLEGVEYFNPDEVVAYTVLLNNRTTAAKVGFFLWQHREQYMLEDKHLHTLKKMVPRSPHYMDRSKEGSLIKEWNLIVPDEVTEHTWSNVV